MSASAPAIPLGPAATAPAAAGGIARIAAVDLLRGLVMIIMALDHVRDYWSMTPYAPEDLSQTSVALFFTRWITHFCAPVFVFLSGASAWLYRASRGCSRRHLSWFLLSRGLWLILVELTLINLAWQFTYQITILQVIWAIGCSMAVLSVLVFLPLPAIVGVGLAMVLGHNLLDPIGAQQLGSLGWLWALFHEQTFVPAAGAGGWQGVLVVYPLVPWIGVMALGYAFGALLQLERSRRDRVLVGMGTGMIASFLLLRGINLEGFLQAGAINLYGDASPWSVQERGPVYTVLSFLNTTKYPPSLLFLLMTLGPAIAVMPLLERWRGRAAEMVTVFGRVPFFFYVLHLYLIHAAAAVWYKLSLGTWSFNPLFALFAGGLPDAYEPNLLRAYAVWVLTVLVLYFPCRWFVKVRRRHKAWWLSYL